MPKYIWAGGAFTRIPDAAGDTTPDAFSFNDQFAAATSTQYTSNSITVSGIDTAAAISVSGGGTPEYSINGGAFTAIAGTVNNGDTVRVRNTSSGSASTTINTTLDIGGVTDTYSITTAAAAGAGIPRAARLMGGMLMGR